MSRLFISTLMAASLCAPALADGQSTTAQPASTIQVNSNLVVVDVVVTDAQHNPVHKLAPADFTVLDSGHPQTLKSFEEHSTSTSPAALPALPKLPPGTFTNYSAAPQTGALNVLLLDTLNTPMNAQGVVHDQILKYLKEARPGTRIAIFGLTTRLFLLQGFTSNPELLRAVLNSKKGLAQGSVFMENQLTGDNPGDDDPNMDNAEDAFGNDPNAAEMLLNMQQFEAQIQAMQLQLRTRYTLDAFNALARYLSGLPGRKNIIWFSGSFPLAIMPDSDLQEAEFVNVAFSEDEFRETADLLSRSQVAVYPIDARGLMNLPSLDAGNSGSKHVRNPSSFGSDATKFYQNTSDEHSTMHDMAQATGGESFVNTNGLKEAVERAIAAGSNYYTLSYSPTNQKWNGDYRKIQINLARQGLTLAYRRGYYADDPNSAPSHGEPPSANKGQVPRFSAMQMAMMRGGPDPTQINFAANVRPSVSVPEPDVAPGNKTVGKVKGPYQRYSVQFGIDTQDLACTATQDNVHHCALETAIFVYDADGDLLNTQTTGLHADLPVDRYAAIAQSGMRFKQEISVPVKGEYFLRIGVHDPATDKVGAVELPVAEVSKLPALAIAGTK